MTARDQLKAESRKSDLEEHFAGELRYLFMDHGWDQDAITREFKFHPKRKWRADFGLRCSELFDGLPPLLHRSYDVNILIEIDGGTWSQGRHTRGSGFRNDSEKLNEAQLLGYTCLRFDSTMVKEGLAIRTVERLLKGEIDGDD